jgi:hypothetical protein
MRQMNWSAVVDPCGGRLLTRPGMSVVGKLFHACSGICLRSLQRSCQLGVLFMHVFFLVGLGSSTDESDRLPRWSLDLMMLVQLSTLWCLNNGPVAKPARGTLRR